MSDDESVSCSSQSENEIIDNDSSSGEEEVIMRIKKGKNTVKNINVCKLTIKPPVAPSTKKLRYAPTKLVIEPIRTLRIRRTGNLSVNKKAVAPGVTTNAITKNAPTVCSAATHEADKSIKNIAFKRPVFKPIDLA